MPEETREQKMARKVRAGAWLEAERKKRGLSQTALAELLGLPAGSQNRISNYENAVYEMKWDIVPDIAHALGLPEYDTARGLEIWMPAEVATRRRLIAYAMQLLTDKDAEDLIERLLPQLRARVRGAKNAADRDRRSRVTRPGRKPDSASHGEQSAI